MDFGFLALYLLLFVEIHHIRCARSGVSDIRSAIAIQVAKSEAVGGSLAVSEADLGEFSPISSIEENRGLRGDITNDDVWMAIKVHVARGQRIRNARSILKFEALTHVALAIVHIDDHQSGDFIADYQIQIAIAVEVRNGAHARVGASR